MTRLTGPFRSCCRFRVGVSGRKLLRPRDVKSTFGTRRRPRTNSSKSPCSARLRGVADQDITMSSDASTSSIFAQRYTRAMHTRMRKRASQLRRTATRCPVTGIPLMPIGFVASLHGTSSVFATRRHPNPAARRVCHANLCDCPHQVLGFSHFPIHQHRSDIAQLQFCLRTGKVNG
jgi:hypothetical protein